MYLPSYFLSHEVTVAPCAPSCLRTFIWITEPRHVLGCPEVERQIPGVAVSSCPGALGAQGCPGPCVRTHESMSREPCPFIQEAARGSVDVPGRIEHAFLSLTAELAASKINTGLQILKIWFYGVY